MRTHSYSHQHPFKTDTHLSIVNFYSCIMLPLWLRLVLLSPIQGNCLELRELLHQKRRTEIKYTSKLATKPFPLLKTAYISNMYTLVHKANEHVSLTECLPPPLSVFQKVPINKFNWQKDKWIFITIVLTQGDPVPLSRIHSFRFRHKSCRPADL